MLISILGLAITAAGCGDDGGGDDDGDAAAEPSDAGDESSDAAAPAPSSCPLSDPEDPLCVVNQAFRGAYAALRAEVVAATDPVVISLGDTVILHYNGERQEAKVIGDLYHELKSISHVPLALHVMLVRRTDVALDATTRTTLESFRPLVEASLGSLDGRGLTAEQTQRNQALLQDALDLIDQVLQDGQISAETLRSYTSGTVAAIDDNVREAAVSQLELTHQQMTQWMDMMTQEERDRLRVIVANAHMPRKGSLTNQYFTALVGDPYEGKFDDENIAEASRMFAVENVWDEQGLLNTLGTHLVDGDVGVYFFDDYDRMHRDLLADATQEWIEAEFVSINAQPVCTPEP